MLIIRGVNVFPSQIEDVMKTFPQVASWYQIELTRKNHLDVVTLKVEPNPSFAFDEVRAVELLQRSVSERLKSALSVGLRVLIVPPGSIPRSEGKAVRVKDLRGDDK
jgi:phenylacetate-CoA ligase